MYLGRERVKDIIEYPPLALPHRRLSKPVVFVSLVHLTKSRIWPSGCKIFSTPSDLQFLIRKFEGDYNSFEHGEFFQGKPEFKNLIALHLMVQNGLHVSIFCLFHYGSYSFQYYSWTFSFIDVLLQRYMGRYMTRLQSKLTNTTRLDRLLRTRARIYLHFRTRVLTYIHGVANYRFRQTFKWGGNLPTIPNELWNFRMFGEATDGDKKRTRNMPR